jgi:ribosomal protein S27AE
VDGAFRDVPVYKQHGDMTGSDIDVSAALMSAELQDLMAECSAENPGSTESVPAGISGNVAPCEEVPAEYSAENPGSTESVPAGIYGDSVPIGEVPAESAGAGPAPVEQIGGASDPFAHIVIKSTFTDAVFGERAATAERVVTDPDSIADTTVEGIQEGSVPEKNVPIEDIPVTMSCSSCGAGISGTKKFCGCCGAAVSTASPAESTPAAILSCGSCGAGITGTKKFCGRCGAAVSHAPAADSAPVSSGITANGNTITSHPGSRPAAEPVVNLKSIEELDDLSWLTD